MTRHVLIVDDDRTVAEQYRSYLDDRYAVRTANSGAAAMEQIDDAIDVVLLDRHMPGVTGDEVLRKIRRAGYDCKITMVTGIEPDVDVIDMPFDSYLVKPVSADQLIQRVESMLALSTFEEQTQQVYAIASKVGLLESRLSRDELDDDPEYQSLKSTLRERRQLAAKVSDSLDDTSFRRAFQAIGSG